MIETTAALEPFEVDDLDADTLLWLIGDAESQDRAAGRRKLRYALRWSLLHPGTEEDHATLGHGENGPATECDVVIAGEGSPLVAVGAAEEFAAALGISVPSATGWLADALDLAHRLPHHWARVEALAVPVWKPRQVARLTRSLPPVAAAWVDAQLAGRLARVGMPTIERTVAEAIAVFCPDRLDEREQAGKAGWRVDLEHGTGRDEQWHGTSFLDATGDTADLTALHDLARRIAEQLRRAGDTDTLDQRKAKALGLIGRGHADDPLAIAQVAAATAVTDTNDNSTDGTTDGTGEPPSDAVERAADLTPYTEPRATHQPERRRPGQPIRLYLHVGAADLAAHFTGDSACPTGYVERVGLATLDLLRTWLGHQGFTVTPVLDPDRTGDVDAHDPPAWMRDLVLHRDQHCVGPWCQVDARSCDLDHIVPYAPNGPPGQTHPEGLAPLCRRHHRAKTHMRWRYHRAGDGSYTWTGPRDQRFLVHPEHGTFRLDDLGQSRPDAARRSSARR